MGNNAGRTSQLLIEKKMYESPPSRPKNTDLAGLSSFSRPRNSDLIGLLAEDNNNHNQDLHVFQGFSG